MDKSEALRSQHIVISIYWITNILQIFKSQYKLIKIYFLSKKKTVTKSNINTYWSSSVTKQIHSF